MQQQQKTLQQLVEGELSRQWSISSDAKSTSSLSSTTASSLNPPGTLPGLAASSSPVSVPNRLKSPRPRRARQSLQPQPAAFRRIQNLLEEETNPLIAEVRGEQAMLSAAASLDPDSSMSVDVRTSTLTCSVGQQSPTRSLDKAARESVDVSGDAASDSRSPTQITITSADSEVATGNHTPSPLLSPSTANSILSPFVVVQSMSALIPQPLPTISTSLASLSRPTNHGKRKASDMESQRSVSPISSATSSASVPAYSGPAGPHVLIRRRSLVRHIESRKRQFIQQSSSQSDTESTDHSNSHSSSRPRIRRPSGHGTPAVWAGVEEDLSVKRPRALSRLSTYSAHTDEGLMTTPTSFAAISVETPEGERATEQNQWDKWRGASRQNVTGGWSLDQDDDDDDDEYMNS